MEAPLIRSGEVENMLLKIRKQAAKLLRTSGQAEVVHQLQEALDVLQGKLGDSRKYCAPEPDDMRCVSMSEEKGIKKRRMACLADGCTELPTFGWPVWRPESCPVHAHQGMEAYVPKLRCGKGLACPKHSSFGWPGHSQTCCKIHAAPGMENVISKRCTTEGCAKRPVFGWERLRPVRCKAHAEPDMRDVIHSQCDVDGCARRPSFGRAGDARPSRCKIHLEPGMEDIVTKRCDFEDCYQAPAFAFGRDPARRCETHREPGMVRKRKRPGGAGGQTGTGDGQVATEAEVELGVAYFSQAAAEAGISSELQELAEEAEEAELSEGDVGG